MPEWRFNKRLREKYNIKIKELLPPKNKELLPPRKIGGRKKRQRSSLSTGQGKDAVKPSSPALAPYVDSRFKIHMTHKGYLYEARVRSNGTIYFDGNVYNSPSGAARAALGFRTNGWKKWKYRIRSGEWVWLDELRYGQHKPTGRRRAGIDNGQRATSRRRRSKSRSDTVLNTIVCPGNDEDFEKTFLGEHCWTIGRIRETRIADLRYIAIYRRRPVSAITHFGPIDRIQRNRRTGEVKIYLQRPPRRVKKTPRNPSDRAKRKGLGFAIYTDLSTLREAKTLDDL